MVNPDDLIKTEERETLENFEEGTLKEEARESVVRRKWFGKNKVERKREEVYLPILLIPGVASSGLVVEKSSLDKRYEGQRLWTNPGFLAKARFQKKVFNEDELCDDPDPDGDLNKFAQDEDELAIKNASIHHIGLDTDMVTEKPGNRVRPYPGVSFVSIHKIASIMEFAQLYLICVLCAFTSAFWM